MRRDIVTCRLIVPELYADKLSGEVTDVIHSALRRSDLACDADFEKESEASLAWHVEVPESVSSDAARTLEEEIATYVPGCSAETRFEVYRWSQRYGRRSESLSEVEGSDEAVANNQRLFTDGHRSPRSGLELDKF